MITKSVNKISVDEEILNIISENKKKILVNKYMNKLTKEYKELINKIFSKRWIKISNRKIYLVKDKKMLIPDTKIISGNRDGMYRKFEGYIGRMLNKEEALDLFYRNKKDNPLIENGNKIINKFSKYHSSNSHIACFNNNKKGAIDIIDGSFKEFMMGDDITIKIPVYDLPKEQSFIEFLLIEKLIPEELNYSDRKFFSFLSKVQEVCKVNLDEGDIVINKITDELVKKLEEYYSKDESLSKIKNKEIKNVKLTEQNKKVILGKYINCDKTRADLEPYNMKMIEDINMGHWDLWNSQNSMSNGNNIVMLDSTIVGRNPVCDIKEDGIVGIDFGTKSTVVVFQDGDENTTPMRIGVGQLNKKVNSSHYENPTIMEFRNLKSFLNEYNKKQGRPDTKWEDMTVSHTAFNSFINSQSTQYYSYFDNLKQWAGNEKRQIKIKDKKNNEIIIKPFSEIQDEDFNPIELYAYYIGLYINNMYNGIYMYYLLSFPVTYEKNIRDKIIESFNKGIRKSLPQEVLEDEQAMKNFRVIQGASEPAAYAICALQEYGFDPCDDEEIFYGIFDFGGGTTDFDFGIWKSDDEDYDYVIEHFGAGGDKYLGGENLLELLSFEVFKKNQDILRKEKISFLKPDECKSFAGSEILISQSEEAGINTKQLMEKLRPLWEEHEGYEKLYENGVIKVNLFDNNGSVKMNLELIIDMDELKKTIHNRIEKGIRNFFESLKLIFLSESTKDIEKINIFLAGNSSSSNYVTEIFDKYINEYTCEINKIPQYDKEYFKVYPPLGTEEANRIQKELKIDSEIESIMRPTGKTGVAFGLIDGRPGSRINVISEKKSDEEIKFNYYIGQNSKKHFKVIMDRNIEYGEWIRFRHAKTEDFEIYYTNLPEATTNKLSIREVNKKICRMGKTDEEMAIYIRAVSPSVIEFTVANEEGIKNSNLQLDVIKIELS